MTALWDLIRQRQVVYIRGTPATGKSTLARLLARHVSILEPELEVYHLCWPEFFDYLAPYSYLLNDSARRPQDSKDWMCINGLLIIDEAQASYQYSSLWNDLIKFLEPGFGLRVALFSSYGSASALVQEASTLTPLKLNSNQRVSLERSAEHPDLCLLLSHDEFHNLVYRRCLSYGDSQPFRPSTELIEHLFGLIQGHAAASVMHFLSLLSLYPPSSTLTAHPVHFLSNVGIDWLFHVVFADNFSSCTVYDSDCKSVPGESQIALLR